MRLPVMLRRRLLVRRCWLLAELASDQCLALLQVQLSCLAV